MKDTRSAAPHQSRFEKAEDHIRTHRTLPIKQFGKHSTPSTMGSTTNGRSRRYTPREASESEPEERRHQRLAPGPVERTELMLVVFTVVPRMDEVERGSCQATCISQSFKATGKMHVRLLLLLIFTSTFTGAFELCFLPSPGKFNNSWLTSSIFSHLSLVSLPDPLTAPMDVSAAAAAVGLLGGVRTVVALTGAGGRGVLSSSGLPEKVKVPISDVLGRTNPRAAASTAGWFRESNRSIDSGGEGW